MKFTGGRARYREGEDVYVKYKDRYFKVKILTASSNPYIPGRYEIMFLDTIPDEIIKELSEQMQPPDTQIKKGKMTFFGVWEGNLLPPNDPGVLKYEKTKKRFKDVTKELITKSPSLRKVTTKRNLDTDLEKLSSELEKDLIENDKMCEERKQYLIERYNAEIGLNDILKNPKFLSRETRKYFKIGGKKQKTYKKKHRKYSRRSRR